MGHRNGSSKGVNNYNPMSLFDNKRYFDFTGNNKLIRNGKKYIWQ